jgi:phage tail sheath gpL-like
MVAAFFANNTLTELWVPPFNDAAGTAGTMAMTFTGTATANGTINLYIAGEKVPVGITNGDVQNTIATKVNTAIALYPDLPITAGVATNVVTLTAKNLGTFGNEIYVSFNTNRLESTPAGVTVPANAYLTGGATDPTITFAGLGEEPFEYIGFPYSDTTSLNTLQSFLDARWNYDRMLYGMAFGARNDTVAALTTFGAARNDEHISVFGYVDGTPTWCVDVVGMVTAQAASALSIDPARTLQTLPLVGF